MSVTTEQLIDLAKEACDFEESQFVTGTKWLSWANAALPELHRFVTNKFADTYFRTFDFTLDAGEFQQVLPSNFWRLKGLTLDPGTNLRRTVRPFNFAERDGFSPDGWWGRIPVCDDRQYSVLSRALLQIEPSLRASGTYRLYYTPRPKLLAAVRTIERHVTDAVSVPPDDVPVFYFPNFNLAYPVPGMAGTATTDVGNLLTITGAATAANNATRTIISVPAQSSARTNGTAVAETFGPGVVATLATCMDDELEDYAEYVWLSMAIKACNKEESFVQAKALGEQRNLIRADLEEAVLTDAGGPQTVIDVNGDGGDGGGWL